MTTLYQTTNYAPLNVTTLYLASITFCFLTTTVLWLLSAVSCTQLDGLDPYNYQKAVQCSYYCVVVFLNKLLNLRFTNLNL